MSNLVFEKDNKIIASINNHVIFTPSIHYGTDDLYVNYEAYIKGPIVDRLNEYEQLGMEPEEIKEKIHNLEQELKELKDVASRDIIIRTIGEETTDKIFIQWKENAAQMRTVYLAFLSVGFSEEEAIKLLLKVSEFSL